MRITVDATHLKAHRKAASLLRTGCSPPYLTHQGRGLNFKPQAVCDQAGWPIILKLSAGQVSDHKGAAMVLEALPAACWP